MNVRSDMTAQSIDETRQPVIEGDLCALWLNMTAIIVRHRADTILHTHTHKGMGAYLMVPILWTTYVKNSKNLSDGV